MQVPCSVCGETSPLCMHDEEGGKGGCCADVLRYDVLLLLASASNVSVAEVCGGMVQCTLLLLIDH